MKCHKHWTVSLCGSILPPCVFIELLVILLLITLPYDFLSRFGGADGGRGREKLNAFLRQRLGGKMQNIVLESQSRAVSSTSPVYHRNEKGLQSLMEKENSWYLDVAMRKGLSD